MIFAENIKEQSAQLIDEDFWLEGGTLRIKNGVLIDGKLTNVTIMSMTDAPIIVSALGRLTGCKVECVNFINEGEFDGEVTASENVEIKASATTRGTIQCGGKFYTEGNLGDGDYLKIKGLSKPKVPKVNN